MDIQMGSEHVVVLTSGGEARYSRYIRYSDDLMMTLLMTMLMTMLIYGIGTIATIAIFMLLISCIETHDMFVHFRGC